MLLVGVEVGLVVERQVASVGRQLSEGLVRRVVALVLAVVELLDFRG